MAEWIVRPLYTREIVGSNPTGKEQKFGNSQLFSNIQMINIYFSKCAAYARPNYSPKKFPCVYSSIFVVVNGLLVGNVGKH